MARVIKILDYKFRKMRESMARDRKEMKERHAERMKETDTILQRIRDKRAKFERKWFKLLEGGDN